MQRRNYNIILSFGIPLLIRRILYVKKTTQPYRLVLKKNIITHTIIIARHIRWFVVRSVNRAAANNEPDRIIDVYIIFQILS